MKIAFITNTCWNVYNFREGLAKHFLENGHEVLSFAPRDEYTELIENWGIKFHETPLDQTGSNPIHDFSYLLRLVKAIRTHKPDVMLGFTIKSNIYGSLAGKILGVPIICNVSGLGTVFLVRGLTGFIAKRLYQLAFRYSSQVFFQNEDDKKLFLSHIRIEDTKIGVLPGSGVDLVKFHHSPYESNEKVKFLMIARIIEEKGVREFVEAARIVGEGNSNVDFTLVGNHDSTHARSISKEELEQWVKEGIIHYLPHTSNINQIIMSHEVVVLPSYREGTPRTLLEGAAIGRALLTSDVPGCREVVIDGYNGFLFEVKNARSLASKMKLYLSLSDEEKAKMGHNSRDLVERKFDENIVIRHYVEAIGQIVDK